MCNFLFPAVFEDFNLFRLEIGDEFAFAVSDDRVDLDKIRRDANYIDVFGLRRLLRRGRWRRQRACLLCERRRDQQKQRQERQKKFRHMNCRERLLTRRRVQEMLTLDTFDCQCRKSAHIFAWIGK